MADFLGAPQDPTPTGARRIWTYLETVASLKYSTFDDLRNWLQRTLSLAASRITSGVISTARLSSDAGAPGQFLQRPADGETEATWGDPPSADALDIHGRLTTRQTAPDGADRIALSDESEAGTPTKWAALSTIRTWLQSQLSLAASRITSGTLNPDRISNTAEAEDNDWLFYRGNALHWGKPVVGRGDLLWTFELPTQSVGVNSDITPSARTLNDDPAPPAGIQLPANDDAKSVQVPYLPPGNIRGMWAVAKVGDAEQSATFVPWGGFGTRNASATYVRSYGVLLFSDRLAVQIEWEFQLGATPTNPGRGSYIKMQGLGATLPSGSRVEFYAAP